MQKDPRSILKIAVVDDSDFSRRTVVEILERNKFQVVGEVSNAEDAIALLPTSGVNLFLIDVVMPNIGGMELAKKIKELASVPISIVMMSSLDLESIIIESISNGAIDFLAKPFDEETLIKSITKIGETQNKGSL